MSKFCVNCKFFKQDSSSWVSADYGRCTKDVRCVNPVTGAEDLHFCSVTRQSFGGCGPSGKWFEPKESVPVSSDSHSTATNNNERGFLEWVKSLFIART